MTAITCELKEYCKEFTQRCYSLNKIKNCKRRKQHFESMNIINNEMNKMRKK